MALRDWSAVGGSGTLEHITKRLSEANDFVGVASRICMLSEELYGIHSCIVTVHDANGRPLYAVDNVTAISDEHRAAYFDELWRNDPLLFLLRVVGNQAVEAPNEMMLERGEGYMDHVVHTIIVPLLCPRGLLGAIKFRHNERIEEALHNDLTTLGTAASVRLTELNVAPRPDPKLARLTPRQLDVARCAAKGMTNADIAEYLTLSENTVKKHLKDLFEELEVANRTELAARINRAGPVNDHPPGITHRGKLTITRAST